MRAGVSDRGASDACRAWVSDDENSQAATKDAFEVLHFIAAMRLAVGRLAVGVDTTNVQELARRPLLALAQQCRPPVAIVFDLPERVWSGAVQRTDRRLGRQVIGRPDRDLSHSLRGISKEGFRAVHVLSTPEAVDAARVEHKPLDQPLRRAWPV